eukprot:6821288-Pyramimonas_sp.AAC.1
MPVPSPSADCTSRPQLQLRGGRAERRACDRTLTRFATCRRRQVSALPGGCEAGGLSGAPLMAPSTALLAEMYILTKGE